MTVTLADHLRAGPIEPWRLELIAKHARSVQRYAPALERRYRSVDVEPIMFRALYLAAFTWRPDGPAGFHHWYRLKLLSATGHLRRRFARHDRGLRRGPPIRTRQLDEDMFDGQFFYRNGVGEEEEEAADADDPAVRQPAGRYPKITHGGATRTLKEWSRATGIGYTTLRNRYRAGMTPAQIVRDADYRRDHP